MNYMSEVAKMFGVELGEKFNIDFCREHWYVDKDKEHSYFFSEKGVEIATEGYGCISADVLLKLLCGEWAVKKKPYKPQSDDAYWCVRSNGSIESYPWRNDIIDFLYYKLGNCYRTKEEAEANCDKWVAFYESDDVLEV